VVAFGPPFGLARDLVTGAVFVTVAGSAAPGLTDDGMGLFAGTGGADNTVGTAQSISSWAITGDLTVAWRGFVGDTGNGGGMLANGDDTATNSPWRMFFGGNFAGHSLFRAGPSGYRRWAGPSPGSTSGVHYNTIVTKSVSHGTDISVAPTFYTAGIAGGAASSQDGAGSGPASGGPFQLRSAFGYFSQAWHTSNIAIAGARQWTADEHLLFHLDPYGAVEEAPRWYFARRGEPEPDTAARGGDDAPARREDIDRLARRRKRQEAEQTARAAQLRATIERAYRAATGQADEEAEATLAEAVQIAPPAMRERIADVVPMLGTARALAELRAILASMQTRRDMLAREDDEMAFILSVL
jgi:hypothetical protein